MFVSVKRALRSERTLLGAVVVSGVSVGLLVALIVAKSDGVDSPPAPISTQNYTIEASGFDFALLAALPTDDPPAAEILSPSSLNLPAFPGKDFDVFPSTQGFLFQPSASSSATSVETPTTSEGIGEQEGEIGAPTSNVETEDSVVGDSPVASATVVPVEPVPRLVGPSKLLPWFSGADFLPDASGLVGDSMFGDSAFDGGAIKDSVRAIVPDEWGDLSLAGVDVFRVSNPLDVINSYRSHLGDSDWTLYADVEGVVSVLMYILNGQTLVILTLESSQMRLFDQESEGVAVFLFDNG